VRLTPDKIVARKNIADRGCGLVWTMDYD
jgi:hypothetical protein